MIDPWFQDQGRGFFAKTVRPEMERLRTPLCGLFDTPEHILSDVDACLITHVRPDHVSKDYMPDEIPLIAQDEEDARKLREMGFIKISCFTGSLIVLGKVRIHRAWGIHVR